MKYQLETIPIWEAFRQNSECPLCLLEESNQKNYTNFFLGDSVMDPDIRIEVNKKGFCALHLELLFKGGHKLGLALMAHTHLQELLQKIKKKAFLLISKTENASGKSDMQKPFKREKTLARSLKELRILLSTQEKQCLFCERLNTTLRRYAFTIIYLFKKDEKFSKVLKASRGFCLHHLILILDMASENLSKKMILEFLKMLLPLQEKNLERLEKELHWFTKKFDYRNQDKSWKTSKDALPRTLQKLAGKIFRELQ